MRLSELEVENLKVGEPAESIYEDAFISEVVYGNLSNDNHYNDWCIVFGNSNQIKERAKTVIEKYKEEGKIL